MNQEYPQEERIVRTISEVGADLRVEVEWLPEWGAVTMSFYNKAMPGFTVSLSPSGWEILRKTVNELRVPIS